MVNFLSLGSFFIIYLLALYYIIPKRFWIPWIRRDSGKNDYEKYEKKQDVEGFYKQLIDETYTWSDEGLRKIEKHNIIILRIMMVLLLIGTFIPLMSFVYIYSMENDFNGIIALSIITLIFCIIVVFFDNKFGKEIGK